ncbi:hypothetical protein [Sphingobacterium tabacisoli]|uniref:Uncharacterized protein n=1 Tax=Sphingobacterium tabacisoli TaxID=2044855 RepID=A0ABW5L3D2_9SPHI|nr:hypothetical protein [Sphingobacterium tabacisoli]
MDNLGISVKLNGKQVSRAGFDEENFVLTAMATLVHREGGSEELLFDMSGLDAATNKHLDWHNAELKLGDVISLEIVKGEFDAPYPRPSINETSDEEVREYELKRYHQLREELKGYLEE